MTSFRKTTILAGLSMLFCMPVLFAQEIGEDDYNEFSVRPIRRADQMYVNTIWLQMDLRVKQNEPFFAVQNEISKIIIQAVKDGLLKPYTNDSLNHRMAFSDFKENLKLPGGEEPIDDGFDDGSGGGDWGGGGEGGGWGDDGGGFGGDGGGWGGDAGAGGEAGGKKPAAGATDEFFPKQINLLKIREDLIFDRKRSRMYHDIQAITLIIPGDNYPSGVDKELATFSYKELVENVFLDNSKAIWYNPKNLSDHRNLADAFDLRLFAARIIKYANPKDNYIDDIYSDPKASLGFSQVYEYNLLEYESNMWSN